MLLIAMSLSLLVIYAGASLMLRAQLEALHRFYKYTARFIIAMGLLGFLYAVSVLVIHNCGTGYWQHRNAHCRMHARHPQVNPVLNQDSTRQMYPYSKCCPPVYCSEHISEYSDESIFYPKGCVCCPDKGRITDKDSISE